MDPSLKQNTRWKKDDTTNQSNYGFNRGQRYNNGGEGRNGYRGRGGRRGGGYRGRGRGRGGGYRGRGGGYRGRGGGYRGRGGRGRGGEKYYSNYQNTKKIEFKMDETKFPPLGGKAVKTSQAEDTNGWLKAAEKAIGLSETKPLPKPVKKKTMTTLNRNIKYEEYSDDELSADESPWPSKNGYIDE